MTAAPTPPWLYLDIAAALLTAAAWITICVWFRYLPVLRSVKITAALVCVAAAASAVLPLLGAHARPALSLSHLIGGAAFLGFAAALTRTFRLAATRRPSPADSPPRRIQP